MSRRERVIRREEGEARLRDKEIIKERMFERNRSCAHKIFLGLQGPIGRGDNSAGWQRIVLDSIVKELSTRRNLTRHEVAAAWSVSFGTGLSSDPQWAKLLATVDEIGKPVLAVGLDNNHLRFYTEGNLRELQLQKEPLAMVRCEDGVYRCLGLEIPFHQPYGLSSEALNLQIRCQVHPVTGALSGETQQLKVELERTASVHPDIPVLVNEAYAKVARADVSSSHGKSRSSEAFVTREAMSSMNRLRPGGLLPDLEASAVKELEHHLQASARLRM